MKLKILFLFLLSFSALAIDPERLKFSYQSYEGDIILECRHFAIDEYKMDFDVTCKNQNGFYKLFRTHVVLSQYQRPMTPQNTYELLYWVTDKTTNKISSNGSSLWLNAFEKNTFHSLTIGQSVDNDTAGLYLDIKP
jgi:hypothetical protein